MQKKILLVNEASYLNSGYARYGRELLRRLYKKYEVAELGCHMHVGDTPTMEIPWKLYPAAPNRENKEYMDAYNSNQENVFGKLAFEEVTLDFQPTHVLSIRDCWFDKFIDDSPFRNHFNWLHLAPVDAYPQNTTWLDIYSRCEGLMTYNDWSKSILENYGLDVHDSAPAKAPSEFVPMPKIECKVALGLPKDAIIMGTVMRNQPRKLFDKLFVAFKRLSDKYENLYLYCHTGFPDKGSDIPDLLLKHGVAHKVFFTYKCKNCGAVTCQKYSDAMTACYRCLNISASTCHMNNTVNDKELAHIFNSFDIYIQYVNAGGLEMPIIEAASCGVTPISVDYSAMSDVVRKCGGLTISPLSLNLEITTGREMAIPDNDRLVESKTLNKMISDNNFRLKLAKESYRQCLKNYNWDETAEKWSTLIEKVPNKKWNFKNEVGNLPEYNEMKHMSNRQYVRYLIDEVWGNKIMRDTYLEHYMCACLNTGAEQENYGSPMGYRPYTRENAFHKMHNYGGHYRMWETRKREKFQL